MSSNPIFRCLLSGPVMCAAVFATHAVGYAQGNSAQTPAAKSAGTESASALAARFELPSSPALQPQNLTPLPSQPLAVNAAYDLARLRPDQVLTSQQLVGDTKALVKGGDPVGAARKLATLNVAQADSAAWHRETTQRLVHLAGQLSREGSAREAKTLVTEALRQLDQAVLKAKTGKDGSGEARAHLAAGTIHDRFRGDPVAAIASYESAVRANPADAAAKEALERLQKSYANLLARGKKVKK